MIAVFISVFSGVHLVLSAALWPRTVVRHWTTWVFVIVAELDEPARAFFELGKFINAHGEVAALAKCTVVRSSK